MKNSSEIGNKAEQFAADYLQGLNYTILHKNWRYRHAEIDIIAKDTDTIVFVEVKARHSRQHGHPEDFVDQHKIKKMQEAAEAYIYEFNWMGELRFDIIAIENRNITHFKDAFY